MNSQTPALGVRFEIDKLEQVEGTYGQAAWLVFWRAVDAASLPKGTFFHEGDTAKTLNGGEYVYCLVVQSADSQFINRVRTALKGNQEYQRFAASPQFVTDRSLYSEPLPEAGHVDDRGDLVVFQYSYLRPALGQVNREKRAGCPSPALTIPERPRPALPRTANQPEIVSLSDLRKLLSERFVPPKQSPDSCYVTPEELCDMVDRYGAVIQAYCRPDPHHFSGDAFSVLLYDREEVEGSKPYRLTGLFPFASAADALGFCGFEGGIDASAWGILGKHAMNFQGSEGGRLPGRDELKDSEVDANALWERVCRRRHELGVGGQKKWWQVWR